MTIFCELCGIAFEEDDEMYQVRFGWYEEPDDEFLPKEEVAHYHKNCMPY